MFSKQNKKWGEKMEEEFEQIELYEKNEKDISIILANWIEDTSKFTIILSLIVILNSISILLLYILLFHLVH